MRQVKLSILTIVAVIASATFAFSKDENLAKRVFLLENFNSVSVSSGIDLYLQPSNKNEASVVSSKDVLNDVEVTIKGSQVVIRFKNGFHWSFKKNSGVKVYLSYKQLNAISASGGSDVYMNNNETLKSNRLQISGSGGADFKLKVEVGELSCDTSGGSDLYLSGSATNASFSSSGGSDVKAKDLIVKECTVQASGGSDASITATESLTVQASGASDVYYWGSPKKTSISASGASDVKGRK